MLYFFFFFFYPVRHVRDFQYNIMPRVTRRALKFAFGLKDRATRKIRISETHAGKRLRHNNNIFCLKKFTASSLRKKRKLYYLYFSGLITTTGRKLDRETESEHILEVNNNNNNIFCINRVHIVMRRAKVFFSNTYYYYYMEFSENVIRKFWKLHFVLLSA